MYEEMTHQCVQDNVEREDECLVEMRLYVPPGHPLAKSDGAAGKQKRGEGSEDEGEEDVESTDAAAAALHAAITKAAGIAGVTGDAIAGTASTADPTAYHL